MIHTIFWIYILSLVVTSLSIFTSLVLSKKVGQGWYKEFTRVLLSFALFQLSYTLFFFTFKYGHGLNSFLNILMLITIWTISLLFSLLFLRLTESVLERRLPKMFRLTLFGILLLSLISFVTYLLVRIPVAMYISVTLFTGYILALFTVLIKNYRLLFESQEKRIILYLIGLSILLLPVEIVEYYIHKLFILEETYIPMGALTFSLFCLLLNFFNIMHSIKLFHNLFLPDETAPAADDYDDVPPGFITAFSITSRESQIVEYIVKGYNHQDIAEYLKISKRTVERHSYNVYKKCNINNRVELMNLIREYQ